MAKRKGWNHESVRHSLARRGIKTKQYEMYEPLYSPEVEIKCKQCGGPNSDLRTKCQYCGSILIKEKSKNKNIKMNIVLD